MSFRTRLGLLFFAAMTVLVVATLAATYLIVQSNLRSTARAEAARLARSAAAIEDPREVSLDRIAGPGARIWLTDSSGRVIAQSYSRSPALVASAGRPRGRAAPSGSTTARVARRGGGAVTVVLAGGTIESTLNTLASTLAVVGVVVIAVSALVGMLLALRALRPIERLRQEADAIPGGQLHRRLSVERDDELGRMAASFNRLLDRVQRATDELGRFVADASHELRTPVTAIHGHARIAARAARGGDLSLASESADIVAAESDRLAATLNELLQLADAEGAEPATEAVRLDRVVADACDELRIVHSSRSIATRLEPVTVTGNPRSLGELATVLIDNALKYSPAPAPVDVTVTADAGRRSSRCATAARGCLTRIGGGPSTGSTGDQPRGRSAAAAWGWRSQRQSPSATGPSSRSITTRRVGLGWLCGLRRAARRLVDGGAGQRSRAPCRGACLLPPATRRRRCLAMIARCSHGRTKRVD